MSNERKRNSGEEINGWRTLYKEKPTNHDINVWKTYALGLLKELKFNIQDYPFREPRQPLMISRFKTAIDPMLVVGLLGHRLQPPNYSNFWNCHHSWHRYRKDAGVKGYTIPELEEYLAGSEREKVYKQLREKRKL